jgi:fatty acid desaturase
VNVLTAHPVAQFRRNPNFYLQYDGFYFLVCAAVLVGLALGGYALPMQSPSWWWAAAWPMMLFGFIWCHLLIHNCTHGNLPKAINRVVGEVLGLVVVVRFASWDIIHMRHHKYSDDRLRDPHPNFPSFWKTFYNTVISVEQQLFQEYFDVWGDTKSNRRRERARAWMSYGTNAVLVAAWFWLLGPWFFFLVFAPTNLLAGLFVVHFNWSTHNGEAAMSLNDMRPMNLTARRYRIGNLLFAGIYAHQLHHERPTLFNPARALADHERA